MISAFRKTKKWNNFPLSIISHVLEVFHIFFFADAVCNVKKESIIKTLNYLTRVMLFSEVLHPSLSETGWSTIMHHE